MLRVVQIGEFLIRYNPSFRGFGELAILRPIVNRPNFNRQRGCRLSFME